MATLHSTQSFTTGDVLTASALTSHVVDATPLPDFIGARSNLTTGIEGCLIERRLAVHHGVHPRTGDELLDHGDAAMWIGKPVAFNEAFFDLFRPVKPKGPSIQ